MITQRLILDGGTPTCIGCHSPLAEGLIQHPHDCPEMRPNSTGPLPPLALVREWLLAHGWEPLAPGEKGTLWMPPGCGVASGVGVPNADGSHAMAGALERIAKRSGLPFGEVLAGMRAIEVGEASHAAS